MTRTSLNRSQAMQHEHDPNGKHKRSGNVQFMYTYAGGRQPVPFKQRLVSQGIIVLYCRPSVSEPVSPAGI